ncbi:MAG: hypothetical protein H8D97_00285 [Proteobacteria bacterium]|nr:hypothetical protein [Pseudomonadota bacterium]
MKIIEKYKLNKGKVIFECCNKKIVGSKKLIDDGYITSCGCKYNPTVYEIKRLNNWNNKNKLIGLSIIGRNKHRQTLWKIKCFCKNKTIFIVVANSILNGSTTSCGCENLKRRSTQNGLNTKFPSEYGSWQQMNYRCNNNGHNFFKNYGGRGISVCSRWHQNNLFGFQNFLKDMRPKPDPNYSIDRINNNSNYEPSNCKWSTQTEQVRNSRNHIEIKLSIANDIKIKHFYNNYSLVSLAEEYNCSDVTIGKIINGKKWIKIG